MSKLCCNACPLTPAKRRRLRRQALERHHISAGHQRMTRPTLAPPICRSDMLLVRGQMSAEQVMNIDKSWPNWLQSDQKKGKVSKTSFSLGSAQPCQNPLRTISCDELWPKGPQTADDMGMGTACATDRCSMEPPPQRLHDQVQKIDNEMKRMQKVFTERMLQPPAVTYEVLQQHTRDVVNNVDALLREISERLTKVEVSCEKQSCSHDGSPFVTIQLFQDGMRAALESMAKTADAQFTQMEEKIAKVEAAVEKTSFNIGEHVVLHSLQAVQLNGKHGTITRLPGESGRFGVKLEGSLEEKAILGNNLRLSLSKFGQGSQDRSPGISSSSVKPKKHSSWQMSD